jgi:hypothetical protein
MGGSPCLLPGPVPSASRRLAQRRLSRLPDNRCRVGSACLLAGGVGSRLTAWSLLGLRELRTAPSCRARVDNTAKAAQAFGGPPWTSAASSVAGRFVPGGAALCMPAPQSAVSCTSAKLALGTWHLSATRSLALGPLAPMHGAARRCTAVHYPYLKRGDRRGRGPIGLAWSPAATTCSSGSKVLSGPAAQGPRHHRSPARLAGDLGQGCPRPPM